MKGNVLAGARFFIQGLRLVFSPGLRRFIYFPLLLNLIILTTLTTFFYLYFSDYLTNYADTFPKWLFIPLSWLFWILFWLFALVINATLFAFLTNILASPFYGLLAEQTEKRLMPVIILHDLPLWKILPRTLLREFRKLLYFLPWLLLCGFLFIFPFTLPLAPFVWWLVISWIFAVQYVDYVGDNHHVSFKNMLKILKAHPLTCFGFGALVAFSMTIPILNLITPPAAVAGGTALWLSLKRPRLG